MKYVIIVLVGFFLVTIVGGLIFFYAGNGSRSAQTSATLGPIIATRDGGLTWKSVGRQTQGLTLPNFSVSTIVGGPRPEKGYSYYIGTTAAGVWRSDDAGDHWLQIADKVLPPALTVTAIGLDASNPATYFVAGVSGGAGHLYRTKTFGQTFQEIYPTSNTQVLVTSAAVDPSDSARVYLGTNRNGLFLTSNDFGTHWGEPQRTFNVAIRSIAVNPGRPDEVFVLTDNGLWRSQNRGVEWAELGRDKIGYSISSGSRLSLDPLNGRTLYLSVGNQLLRSSDSGWTWQNIKLPSSDVTITDVFVDPLNSARLFVTYGRTIAASVDKGSSWALRQFSMNRIISRVFMDPFNPLSVTVTTAAPVSRGIF